MSAAPFEFACKPSTPDREHFDALTSGKLADCVQQLELPALLDVVDGL
jgi:hypothetical protein